MRRVNITLEISEKDALKLHGELKRFFEVVSFKILPDADKLKDNKAYSNLIKKKRQIQRDIDVLLNSIGGL